MSQLLRHELFKLILWMNYLENNHLHLVAYMPVNTLIIYKAIYCHGTSLKKKTSGKVGT